MRTINPDPDTFPDTLAGLPGDVPIIMVNLLKYRELAVYPDGRSDISGREAYRIYSKTAVKVLNDIGAKVFYMGSVSGHLIAPPDEVWDEVLLVRYPSAQAFINMLSMPEYMNATIHRSAALEDSRLIATVEG